MLMNKKPYLLGFSAYRYGVVTLHEIVASCSALFVGVAADIHTDAALTQFEYTAFPV
jgi:hypothetical protein